MYGLAEVGEMKESMMVGAMEFKNMGGPGISTSIRYSLSRVRYSGYSCTILQVYPANRRPGENRFICTGSMIYS